MDKKLIARNFSAASGSYEKYADVQKYCAKNLTDFCAKNFSCDEISLDLGSGSGFIARNLAIATKNIVELDLSFSMAEKSQNELVVCGDISRLPFVDNSFGAIYSSFALQWLEDFDEVFAKIYQLLKKGGFFALCLPVKNSLDEIKLANFESGANFYMRDFPCGDSISKKLDKKGLKEIYLSGQKIEEEYISGIECLKKIKKTGANYSNYESKIIDRRKIKKFNDFFEEKFQNKTSWNVKYFIYQK